MKKHTVAMKVDFHGGVLSKNINTRKNRGVSLNMEAAKIEQRNHACCPLNQNINDKKINAVSSDATLPVWILL